MTQIPAILNIEKYLDNKEEPIGVAAPISVSFNLKDLDFVNKDIEINFNILYSLNEKKNEKYGDGAREPWIQKLASLCNQFGLSKDVCVEYILKRLESHPATLRKDRPRSTKYIKAPIIDTYKRYKKQFGTWIQPSDKMDLSLTPIIPEAVYNDIPAILKEYTDLFPVLREKDLSLIGAITALSGCFPLTFGVYDGVEVSSNLYSMIIAPPASGKGQLNKVRSLTNRVSYVFDQEWATALADRKRAEKNKEIFDMPARKMLYIPANSSKSAITTQLKNNGGYGIIFESEADTLGSMRDKDWANFSDILRKAFHHESVSFLRKTNNEYINIEEPKLSILLSGTQSQVYNLISDVENGLFSRFIFYIYSAKPKWKKDLSSNNFEEIKKTSRDLRARIWNVLSRSEDKKFKLNDKQWGHFNNYFEELLLEVSEKYGESGSSIVFRLGLIAFRIMMLFSIFEIENKKVSKSKSLNCSGAHFKAVLDLVRTLLVHSLHIHSIIGKKGYKALRNVPKLYFNALPDQFSRKQADSIAEQLNIKNKTAEKYIEDLIKEKLIKRIKHGVYEKCK